ncbi:MULTISPECIES: lysine N(6)-hydroxylase/L-ornithine N(5)-oxygenase family protein [Streptomyces]|uniref:L-lysine N6-monooxygenase MbtG n=4 Tax=Streptomyces TaxID=1883 RepID=L8EQJ8_STRR1|nr:MULTISPECIES: SidA/IucD/PvdA family monooxygenase [Streptomyces]MYT44849.1 SidA/IucD/PvdA family monooxygenase [Streptomyces sp. SID5471]KEF03340.1 lysine 6-monooxygenase [Streptomyces rimosus]KEF17571.1 lysine 6-monooxygenase [Streptomyces rimosus]KOT30692.1 lysine 6-monooxygenase [Streptomyces rimosus subsp. rimosus]KOT69476.1 lysine 6-monooxygenase [Streptomyces rimosus subsp. rimosus]
MSTPRPDAAALPLPSPSPGPDTPARTRTAGTEPDPAGHRPVSTPDEPLDLIGIGIGPFNLSLAALAHPLTELRTAFYDQRPAFQWHPGLLIEDATLQVPFLADLVTLADPTSPWSFLNYLKHRERLFPFYFAERFHIHRAEYDAYCRWVSTSLPALHFRHQVDAVRWNADRAAFEVDYTQLGAGGEAEALGRAYARNLALGIGSVPHVPEALKPLADAPAVPVLHSADYLAHRERLLAAEHITVIGGGQSGAEVFLDLLRARPAGREGLHWLARTGAFAPMEYSKLGLEHFTPDYTRYFHALPEPVRDELLPGQWQLHKGIDHGTLAAIHDELYRRTLHGGWPDATLTPGVTVRTAGRVGTTKVELHLEHPHQAARSRLTTDAVVLATGYRASRSDTLLAALDPYMRRDAAVRPRIDTEQRLVLDPCVTGSVFVQNAEHHTHGVGTPDLGLAAWRGATILNTLTGRPVYPLPARTAFTTFGLRPSPPRTAAPRPNSTLIENP